ncbi:MAG: hypothetical protein DMG08_21520 [Acidobacteria bacterium]|nr:MAG: hypothetical protein DMG08_21520 [Acidobacteriota bacterium]
MRQLAAAFVRVGFLQLRKGASKLAHSKEDAPRMLEKSLPGCEGFSAASGFSVHLRVLRVSVVNGGL